MEHFLWPVGRVLELRQSLPLLTSAPFSPVCLERSRFQSFKSACSSPSSCAPLLRDCQIACSAKFSKELSKRWGPLRLGRFFLLFFQHQLPYWKNKSPQLKYMYLDNQFHCNPIQWSLLSGENLNFRRVSQSLSKKGRDTNDLREQQTAFSFPHIVT